MFHQAFSFCPAKEQNRKLQWMGLFFSCNTSTVYCKSTFILDNFILRLTGRKLFNDDQFRNRALLTIMLLYTRMKKDQLVTRNICNGKPPAHLEKISRTRIKVGLQYLEMFTYTVTSTCMYKICYMVCAIYVYHNYVSLLWNRPIVNCLRFLGIFLEYIIFNCS